MRIRAMLVAAAAVAGIVATAAPASASHSYAGSPDFQSYSIVIVPVTPEDYYGSITAEPFDYYAGAGTNDYSR